MKTWIYRLAFVATIWTLMVVVLGAYVRLSHAGLGCPDWPGCYGQIGAPQLAEDVAQANQAYPERPVEYGKALKEMLHRYVAGFLWLFILIIAVLSWRNRVDPTQPLTHPWVLFGLVTFQAILGMLTVTEKLNPTIVMMHLLGGMATLSLLWLLTLRTRTQAAKGEYPLDAHRWMATLALVVLVAQISLGGWTSAHYAALACPELPFCRGQLLPEADYGQAFDLWHGTGIDYEGGILGIDARVAIHQAHRLGAIVVLAIVGIAGLVMALKGYTRRIRRTAWIVVVLLGTQVFLGISTVYFGLPLPIAVAHNGTAALLLLSVVTMNYFARRQ